jgi:hypothetical protein
MIKVKRCSKCKVEKTTEHFSKSSQTKNGFKSWCKECIHEDYIKNQDIVKQKSPKIIEKQRLNLEHKEKEKLGIKICSNCGEEKDISQFSPPDGNLVATNAKKYTIKIITKHIESKY